MKRLILAPLLLTLLVASCSTKKKYNSYREANDACEEWAKKAGTYELVNPLEIIPETTKYGKVVPEKVNNKETYKMPLRWCKQEKETTQVLGLRIPDRKKDDTRQYSKRCTFWCGELSAKQKMNSRVEANFYY